MVSFAGDRFSAIDLLDAPDALADVHVRNPAARGGPAYDDGWLWLPLAPDRVTTRLVGTVQVEVVWSGDSLSSLRITGCPLWMRIRPPFGPAVTADPATALRGVDLVAMDLDGTMLNGRGEVTARVGAAVRRARDEGIQLAFVTGRPLADTRDLLSSAGLHGYVAASNGAIVLDPDGRVLHRRVLDGERAAEVARHLHLWFPELVLGAVDESRLFLDPGFPADLAHEWSSQVCAGSVSDALSDGGMLKVLAAHAQLSAETLAPAVSAALGDEYLVTYSTQRFLEISDIHATKGEAVDAIAAAAGLPTTAVATIGDMPNDLPMLDRSGIAVAVGNADRRIVDVADMIIPGNDHDGVAHLLDAVVAVRRGLPEARG
ncbi:Cof subfamily of IIB subfamily of haloacid dehalogenase superfamily/HAD-superfamily hydrolase, subfamily IIB [Micromonospora haikouensis]|uniref:Cof subfamily of IIB subfamily of haloacid dehalogenase superfamily/HAD-superfamily hydrolase, subfamily IIB n=1 Tax=Micromonospora haikouensis TaxID=686309 RepID=A0A1C4XDE7_9ACTN|nr:HAD-IIB family hydrolase [Micromonospora haikouensis]SCF06476.1 Cof subfamily of IIB subfamily of haloacid dehalogenase superfamily/HAD-superfamily hydrolase, subfamily IIB [Micromonospora haikouensis]